MSKNPFINALVAAGYINILATAVFNSPNYIKDSELGMMAPILFLSTFVISAAIMGYLFIYQPALLVLEGKKSEGAKLFLLTVLSFALIIIATLLAWLLLSFVL